MLLEGFKGHKFQTMIERRCVKAKKKLSKLISETKECIKEMSNIYRYCLWWHATIDNFRSRIEAIESKLNGIRKCFDFFKDKDGK